jgi:hypothetical protein
MRSDSTEEARAACFDFSHYNPARESDFMRLRMGFDWGLSRVGIDAFVHGANPGGA